MTIKAYGICLYYKELNMIKLLLCKSIASQNNWGFLKGIQEKNELKIDTAIREFYEECGIKVQKEDLENYYEQKNELKDIGIFLVNYKNVTKIENLFIKEQLLDHFLCLENSEVRFFNIDNLVDIKKKQKDIVKNILQYFKGENCV
jgi:8-oxo-dGTP pyrophosphatase MutT (NUDIX family)